MGGLKMWPGWGKAYLIIDNLRGFTGYAALYRLDPPYLCNKYVVASAVEVLNVPETYLFVSDKNGKVRDFAELEGSFKGELNHQRALAGCGCGYDIVRKVEIDRRKYRLIQLRDFTLRELRHETKRKTAPI
jgi:hypothetical protein